MIMCDTERRQKSHLRISQGVLHVRERSTDLTSSLSLGSPSSLLDDGSHGNHIPTLATATGYIQSAVLTAEGIPLGPCPL